MKTYNTHPGYIHLMDGPGEGKRFYVQRAPVFVRVVESMEHKWDVLDLIDDEPEPTEEIYVYQQLSWIHVRANNRRDSGFHYDYIHVPVASELKAVLRYTKRWQEWAQLQAVRPLAS